MARRYISVPAGPQVARVRAALLAELAAGQGLSVVDGAIPDTGDGGKLHPSGRATCTRAVPERASADGLTVEFAVTDALGRPLVLRHPRTRQPALEPEALAGARVRGENLPAATERAEDFFPAPPDPVVSDGPSPRGGSRQGSR